MSLGSKKKDKDKDVNSGGEASANYMIGKGREVGRSDTEAVGRATANKTTSSQESDTIQREKVISTSSASSSPRQDQPPSESISTTATISTSEVPQYQYQQQYQLQQQDREQQQSINRALDQTKDNIQKSTDEARREIPRYTQAVNDYQEQTIQSAREIADNYIESQKEIINSLQSAWMPHIEKANIIFTSNWMSPRYLTGIYANMVSSFADNMIAVTRLVNNMMFANMDAYKTSMQQAKDNARELSRIGVNNARTFEQTSRDTTRIGNDDNTSTTSRIYVEREQEGLDQRRI
ncbi:MAG: hypothetical protein JO327_01605 [Nitrososphaeraceae archaeon]|nr:hypothetical protein [Nitrososphaeraceae archaeon]MBV9666805.1 hypothetical protein [Nitrososphaeraceae archaeon]